MWQAQDCHQSQKSFPRALASFSSKGNEEIEISKGRWTCLVWTNTVGSRFLPLCLGLFTEQERWVSSDTDQLGGSLEVTGGGAWASACYRVSASVKATVF